MRIEQPNLDKMSAEIGFELAERNKEKAKEFERIVTKALGILVEDGLLAYVVWLESEGKLDIIESSFYLLRDKAKIIQKKYSNIDITKRMRKAILEEIAPSIQKTLLARQLIERMLIYARYRAKALQE